MSQVIHWYDDTEGKLILDNGKEIDIDSKLFCSAEQAVDHIVDWARRRNLIAENDLVAGVV